MFNSLLKKLDTRVVNFGAPYFTFGLYGIINYLSFYPWWIWQYKTFHDPFIVRHIFSLLICLPLIFHKYWPGFLKKYQALYLYLSIFFTMPFSNTILFLSAPSNTTTLLNSMFVLFVMVLVVDWLSFTILLVLGIILGFIYYVIFFKLPPLDLHIYITPLFTFLWTILTGVFFSRNASRERRNLQLEKQLSAIKTVVASIAHELRTPLLSIRTGASGIKLFLPKLIQGYQAAQTAKLEVPQVYPKEISQIERVMENIDSEVNYSNTVIDSLLTNANQEMINPDIFEKHTIVSCINAALVRYPFNPKEQINLVHINSEHNFYFHGDDLLVIHIIFNLIKNALYAIAAAKKGEIFIKLEKGTKYNTLFFKDTAKGLSNEAKTKLFQTFYSNTPNNTGIGLSYCKMAMESFGGKISVHSEEHQYTEFILQFPCLKSDSH